MNIMPLPEIFDGKGEVSGIRFERVFADENWYIYKRSDNSYEVFRKKFTPVCIDFKKRIYSDEELREFYPKSNNFGVWAWSFPTLKQCLNKIQNEG